MSNLQHGFYSKNELINPDSVMMHNALVKQELQARQQDIIDVIDGKIVKVGVTDLVVYLIDCALPHHEALLPESHLSEIKEYHQSRAFKVLRRSTEHKSIHELIDTVKAFS